MLSLIAVIALAVSSEAFVPNMGLSRLSVRPTSTKSQCSISNDKGYVKNLMMASSIPKKSSCGKLVSIEASDCGPGADKKILGFPKVLVKKIIPQALMFFFILFNYTILRDTKDVLVVTAEGSGAEIIPFLKTYVQLPASIAFTVIYAKLSNNFSQKNVFRGIVATFLAFFGSFATFIYPNRTGLHPVAFADSIAAAIPGWLQVLLPLVAIFRNWTYAMFYMFAELWGSIVVSLLFWGFANEINTVDEAKKYYPLFGLIANVALIFSGQYVKLVSKLRGNLAPGADAWGFSLRLLMAAVVTGGVSVLSLFEFIQRAVISDPDCVSPQKSGASGSKKKKTKLTLGESANFLSKSTYIRDMALLVVGYGMSINIVEVTWKSKLKTAFPDPNAYSAFMGNFSSCTGVVTLLMMLGGRTIFDKFGWKTAAMIPPITLLTTGAAFFSLILFPGVFAPLTAAVGTTPLMLAVLIGAAQNILSKGAKYSLFDPCKEMAYIPLDSESKTKGKAAVDVIGNPLGKSGGSFIQQILIGLTGSLAASTPYLGGILGVVILMWLRAADSLSKQFALKSAETEGGCIVPNDKSSIESSDKPAEAAA
jgi:AAA family ATP:ADP antiporter